MRDLELVLGILQLLLVLANLLSGHGFGLRFSVFQVSCFKFRVSSFGSRDSDFVLRVSGFGIRVQREYQPLGLLAQLLILALLRSRGRDRRRFRSFWAWGLELKCRIQDFGLGTSDFRRWLEGSGLRAEGLGFEVQASCSRVEG